MEFRENKNTFPVNALLLVAAFTFLVLLSLTFIFFDIHVVPVTIMILLNTGFFLSWACLLYRELEFQITDPRLLFLFFAFFFLVTAPLGRRCGYDVFGNSINAISYIYVVLGILGIVTASFFWGRISLEEIKKSHVFGLHKRPFEIAAVACVLLGYAIFAFNYGRIGGLCEALSIHRGDRLALLSSKTGNISYSVFIIIGTTMFLYGMLFAEKDDAFRLKNYAGRGIILVTMMAPLLLFWMMEGERSGIIKWMLPLAGICIYRFPWKLSRNIIIVLAVIAAFLGFSVAGNVRNAVSKSLREQSWRPLVQRMEDASAHWLFARNFAANYFSITGSVYMNEEKRLGNTYIMSLFMWLPRSLYPGKKPLSVSHEYGASVAEKVGRERRFGVGFSPVAEGFINFGVSGPFLVMLFWGLGVGGLSRLVLARDHFLKVFYFMLLPMPLFICRSSFSSNFNYVIYNFFKLAVFYTLYCFLAIAFSRTHQYLMRKE